VFTAKPGVNSVLIDSTPDVKGMFRNLSVSLTMYSGQMCTTPQNIYIPAAGIDVDGEQVSFREVAAGLADAMARALADDPRAADILGAIKSPDTLRRIDTAAAGGEVLLASRRVVHPNFPHAEVRTPVVVKVAADDRDAYMREVFGPVVFVIATADIEESLDLARQSAIDQGAINWLVYTANQEVIETATDAAVDAGVAVAFNLTGGLSVNLPAAFSDFHGTGANPAGTASLIDAAFVAGRFRAVGVSVST
jgi:phenylacetic acid degradation protein paaN